jgi:uncharacterized protein YkwD
MEPALPDLAVCASAKAALPGRHHSRELDAAAEYWSRGLAPAQAIARAGYQEQASTALHLTGPLGGASAAQRESACRALKRADLPDLGSYQHGTELWLLLAQPYLLPGADAAPALAARVLELVNAARTHGARCGRQQFAPAPAVRASRALEAVALDHARDMAGHDYLQHRDREGHTPADRVRAAGYLHTLVGENIAYGPASAEEVVAGWLASPGHCANLLNPGFASMGIAYAPGRGAARRALYWVQLLARP